MKKTLLHDAISMVANGSHSTITDSFSVNFNPNRVYKATPLIRWTSFIIRLILFFFKTAFLISGCFFISLLSVFSYYFYSIIAPETIFFLYIKVIAIAFNVRINHHGEKSFNKFQQLYVSNHTSFLDVIVLCSHKFPLACIAEEHSGFFSFVKRFLLSLVHCIFFKRSDKNQREKILDLIMNHTLIQPVPLLIFPEGVCINNESSLLYQKGVFTLNLPICPVAIKYDKRFFDPYWNRRENGFFISILRLLMSFGIYGDVYWEKPVKIKPNESAVAFSHRVKKIIADKANILNCLWNGYFKSGMLGCDSRLLQVAYKNIYLYNHYNKWNDLKQFDRMKKFDFLSNYLPISKTDEDNKIIFTNMRKCDVILEFSREYLRLKSLPKEKIEKLISSNLDEFISSMGQWFWLEAK